MPRHSRSPSRSRSKKSKKSSSRTRSPSRDRRDDRDRSRERHRRKRDRDRSRGKRSKYSRRRHSSSSSTSSRSSDSRSKSSRSKKTTDRSRSQSVTAPTFVQERYNFSEAVSVLDRGKEAIEEIDRNEFVPQTFLSSTSTTASKKLPEKVTIDLKNEKILLPQIETETPVDSLIHPKFFGDEEERMRRWIRKLYQFRQRQSNSLN